MDEATIGMTNDREDPPLRDEQGPIPSFPPARLDEKGRIIHPSPEERAARSDAIRRTLKVLREQAPADGEDTLEEFMRGIDANRSEGRKLFEGYY